MRRYLVPAVAFLIVVLAFPLWLDFCHDPQVRAEALQGQQDTRDDSTHKANERWKQQFASREVQRESVLTRTSHQLVTARGELARLKARVGVAGRTGGHREPDSSATPPRDSELAVRDSIIASQDTVIQGLDATLTIYQAMVSDRDTVIQKVTGERDAYRISRDAWKKTATRKGIHFRPCAATIVGLDGKPAAGVGLCMTWG